MTTATNTKKIDFETAKALCADAVFVAGEGYVCPADKPGLVQTAIHNSDFDISDELLELLSEGFADAYLLSPELQDIIGQDAAWYFQGADAADNADQTWEDSMAAGQKHYETCWEEMQATGGINGFSLDDDRQDPAVYDNFSI